MAAASADFVVAEHSGSLLAVDTALLTVTAKDSVDQSRRLAEISFDPGAAELYWLARTRLWRLIGLLLALRPNVLVSLAVCLTPQSSM